MDMDDVVRTVPEEVGGRGLVEGSKGGKIGTTVLRNQ